MKNINKFFYCFDITYQIKAQKSTRKYGAEVSIRLQGEDGPKPNVSLRVPRTAGQRNLAGTPHNDNLPPMTEWMRAETKPKEIGVMSAD